MKRQTWIELAVSLLLISLGVLARGFQPWPNFAPVAAIALFSGYYFRSWLWALAVPIVIMAASDWFIGGYDPVMMTVVYAMLALPVALRSLLRRRLSLANSKPGAALTAGVGLVTCAVGSSILFFLATNFGWWATGDMYERSFAGLLHCYAQALVFFKYTLAGDLFFAVLLFGSYAVAMNLGLAGQPQVMPALGRADEN